MTDKVRLVERTFRRGGIGELTSLEAHIRSCLHGSSRHFWAPRLQPIILVGRERKIACSSLVSSGDDIGNIPAKPE
jgi:hypothetical protein